MNSSVRGVAFALAAAGSCVLSACSPAPDSTAGAPDQLASANPAAARAPTLADALAEVPPGEFDPLSVPHADGVVWYGTWEAAMAEKERTGKPVMLHFGSPRVPTSGVCVPGTW